ARLHEDHALAFAADDVLAGKQGDFRRRPDEPALPRVFLSDQLRGRFPLRLERVAESVDGSNESGFSTVVGDDVADLRHQRRQTALGHIRPGPQMIADLDLRYGPRPVRDEQCEQIEGLGRESNFALAGPELARL